MLTEFVGLDPSAVHIDTGIDLDGLHYFQTAKECTLSLHSSLGNSVADACAQYITGEYEPESAFSAQLNSC